MKPSLERSGFRDAATPSDQQQITAGRTHEDAAKNLQEVCERRGVNKARQ